MHSTGLYDNYIYIYNAYVCTIFVDNYLVAQSEIEIVCGSRDQCGGIYIYIHIINMRRDAYRVSTLSQRSTILKSASIIIFTA